MKTLIKITAFIGIFSYLGLAQAAELFSDAWMKSYQEAWNNEPELADKLAKKEFNSRIAYGFKGDEKPKGILVVENGKAVSAGAYNGEEVNWDLRADQEKWKDWLTDGIGLGGIGWAYTTRKLRFNVGDYWAMIKSPTTAGPFVKSFTVMGTIKTDW